VPVARHLMTPEDQYYRRLCVTCAARDHGVFSV
jgi:hypothetical protein